MLQLLPPYTLAADGKTVDGMLTLAAIQTNNYLKKPAQPALPYIGYGRDYLCYKPINSLLYLAPFDKGAA